MKIHIYHLDDMFVLIIYFFTYHLFFKRENDFNIMSYVVKNDDMAPSPVLSKRKYAPCGRPERN